MFRLYYTEVEEKATWDLATYLENEYSKLSQALGFTLIDTVSVFLSPTQEVFDQLTGHVIPDWGEGVADASRNAIIIKLTSLFKGPRRLAKLMRHELVHILIGQVVRPSRRIPRWFNEGLACYFSYDEAFSSGKSISKALISDSIIPLNEIDEVLNFQTEKARLAYEESFSVIAFIEDEFGDGTALAILTELKRGDDFGRAFLVATGQDLIDFELSWLRHIEEKYRWRFLLDFDTFIWILMLALFLSVFVAVKLRNRRTMKRWEEEEGLANL